MARASRIRCKCRVHGRRNANRWQGHRRGQELALVPGRRRCCGEHAGDRQVRRGTGVAEGDAMTLMASGTSRRTCPTILAVLVLFAGFAQAATTDVADAAKRGDRDAVRAALARKADVNAAQIDGSTALHWAAERDDRDMADQLIRAGARVTARTREGVTPLQLAATNGSAAMIDRLLKAGADANAPLSAAGDTALMMASRTGKTDAMRVLVEAGANVNAKEKWGGTTALMWAVSEGHADAARLLVGAGADVDARS